MSLVGKTYHWGSWEITFKENGVLESAGEWIGTGSYVKQFSDSKYDINIDSKNYLFVFKDNFKEFTSNICGTDIRSVGWIIS